MLLLLKKTFIFAPLIYPGCCPAVIQFKTFIK